MTISDNENKKSKKVKIDITGVIYFDKYYDPPEEMFKLIKTSLNKTNKNWELIIIFDDGVKSLEEDFENLCKENKNLKILKLRSEPDFTSTLSAAFNYMDGEIIITIPSYQQIDFTVIPKIVERIDKGADFVIGWRKSRVDPKLFSLGSVFFNKFLRYLTGVHINDFNCSLRAFKKEIINEITFHGDLHRFLPVLSKKLGYKVQEVEVTHLREKGGVSLFNFGIISRRILDLLTIFFLMKFTKKPLRFFGLFGSSILSVGFLVCLYLFIYRFLNFGSLANRPLLIYGTLLIVLGIQLLAIGLIGEIIIFTHSKHIKEYSIEKVLL